MSDDATKVCACVAGAFCQRYQRHVSARMIAICRGEILTPEKCEHYRAVWEGRPLPQSTTTQAAPADISCIHRGEPTRTLDTPGCGCGGGVGVYACAKHGECVALACTGKRAVAIQQTGLRVCETCADRTPGSEDPIAAGVDDRSSEPPTVRNLIYHTCPLAANETWRANVRQLARRWHVFDGRRTVAIVQGDSMHPAAEVQAYLDELGCGGRQDLILPNDKQLREVATFLPLLLSVANADPAQATFYAHTKGNSTRGNRLGAEYWRNQMYASLLDGADECMGHLTRFAAVGTHKMVWGKKRAPYPSRLQHGEWMFSGTFFWFRNADVFGHPNWRAIPTDRYGAEAWLSGMFGPSEVKSVFQPWPETKYPPGSPYNPKLYAKNPIADD